MTLKELIEYAKTKINLAHDYEKTYWTGYEAGIKATQLVDSDWTPCAEGLPEESKIYSVIAVYYQNGSIKDVMDNLWYYGNGEWQKYDDLCKVIAWKPYNPDRKEDADHIVDANKKIEED